MPWTCPWSRDRQRPPVISIVPQFKYQKEGVPQAHVFRSKFFKKARACQWCHQPVQNQGSCCRVCKYVCHTGCESKWLVLGYAGVCQVQWSSKCLRLSADLANHGTSARLRSEPAT